MTSASAGALAAAPKLAFAQTNPLLAPWTGPFGGVPAFDKVRTEHFTPAMDAAIEELRREVRALTVVRSAPTFENTLAGLERTGRTLDRALTVYGVVSGTMSTPEFREAEKVIDPKLSAVSDEITQNPELFSRIERVYETRDAANLTPEQKRLAWYHWDRFVRAGAKLDPVAKKRVADINQRLSVLFVTFNEKLLRDEETHIALTEADLAGLPASVLDAVRQSAKDLKLSAPGAIVNTRSSVEPYL